MRDVSRVADAMKKVADGVEKLSARLDAAERRAVSEAAGKRSDSDEDMLVDAAAQKKLDALATRRKE
jgi:hypothetical protein